MLGRRETCSRRWSNGSGLLCTPRTRRPPLRVPRQSRPLSLWRLQRLLRNKLLIFGCFFLFFFLCVNYDSSRVTVKLRNCSRITGSPTHAHRVRLGKHGLHSLRVSFKWGNEVRDCLVLLETPFHLFPVIHWSGCPHSRQFTWAEDDRCLPREGKRGKEKKTAAIQERQRCIQASASPMMGPIELCVYAVLTIAKSLTPK